MRLSFTIYLAAGLTLAFALVYACAHGYHAYATHHAIAVLNPGGDDLARLRSYLQDDYETVGWSLALAAAQATIIVCARKLKGRSHAAQPTGSSEPRKSVSVSDPTAVARGR